MDSNEDVTVYVSIGRNVGVDFGKGKDAVYPLGSPLPKPDWRRFQLDVEGVLINAGLHIITRADGRGEYEGVAEDAHVVTAIGPVGDSYDASTGTGELSRRLGDQLSSTAAHYLQETIAYSVTWTQWADGKDA